MDWISPGGSGAFLIFRDTDEQYDCGVACDAGTFHTVGGSFELGYLVDAGGVSTRRALVGSIMKLFGINLVAREERNDRNLAGLAISTKTHPFCAATEITCPFPSTRENTNRVLKIYDAAGRLIRTFDLHPISAAVRWTGTNQDDDPLPAGIYFARLKADARECTEKILSSGALNLIGIVSLLNDN